MKFTEEEFRAKVLKDLCEGGFGSLKYISDMVPIEILMDNYDFGQHDDEDDEIDTHNEDEFER